MELRKIQTNKISLVMERSENHVECAHVIDITSTDEASSSSSSTLGRPINGSNLRQADNPPPRNIPFSRRASSHGRRRSPLNSGYWISVELAITMGQIIAAVVVLSLSRHEHPHTPLFTWVIGYASGCVVTLPLLFWRFHNRNRASNQDPPSNGRNSEGENRNAIGLLSGRLKALVEYFKMGLDCFFAIWFVVGNVWIFGGHSSSVDAPNLYRLCIVFLTFSCIGYAMPFLLCATICCCLPCIISVLGFREDLGQNRGATTESINSLPTHKFKKNKHANDKETNSGSSEGGVVAAETENERMITGEDAACCICLAKYVNDDELRELPCSHLFHTDCVDKWLKINASCPLCKIEVGETILSSLTEATANLRRSSMY